MDSSTVAASDDVDVEAVLDGVEPWLCCAVSATERPMDRILDAPDLRHWAGDEDLAAAAAVLPTLVAAWASSNRLRVVNDFERWDDVGLQIREALAAPTAYRVARDTNETCELT